VVGLALLVLMFGGVAAIGSIGLSLEGDRDAEHWLVAVFFLLLAGYFGRALKQRAQELRRAPG
jgi:hypothetical protein